jgi:hypothetical protein
LEKINRKEELVCETGAGVAEPGQSMHIGAVCAGLKIPSRRGTWVRIPPPAPLCFPDRFYLLKYEQYFWSKCSYNLLKGETSKGNFVKNQVHNSIYLQPDFVKYFRLTMLQQEVIKLLVLHNRLSTIRLAKLADRHYESVWRCLKHMEEKGLVCVVETKKGLTNRYKKLFAITGMAFQGLFNVDPEIIQRMGAWIYTIREVSPNKLVEALVYLPQKDELRRVIIPASNEHMDSARSMAMSMRTE